MLRRCLFGPRRGEILAAAGSSLPAVLDQLLTAPAAPGPPLRVSAADTTGPIGQTWVGQPFDQTLAGGAPRCATGGWASSSRRACH